MRSREAKVCALDGHKIHGYGYARVQVESNIARRKWPNVKVDYTLLWRYGSNISTYLFVYQNGVPHIYKTRAELFQCFHLLIELPTHSEFI